MNFMTITVYRMLYFICLILLKILKPWLPLKIKNYLLQREFFIIHQKSIDAQLPLNPIWIHFSSGEIEYVKPLMRELKTRKLPFLATYTSPSAVKMIQNTSEIEFWCALPLDTPFQVKTFLNKINPSQLIISRTDLWPELLTQTHQKNISISLIAATFAPGSLKIKNKLAQHITKYCLHQMNTISVVSETDKIQLEKILNSHPVIPNTPIIPKIRVDGDPRFDQVLWRLQQQKQLPTKLLIWAKTCVLFGSTWPEDEKVILPAIKNLQRNYSSQKLNFLIVPHEVNSNHLEQLKILLTLHQLDYQCWSQIHSEQEIISDILIFDQIGWLADLYRVAQIAFIGGSFKKQVHSVMEALGCNLPVIVGPFYENNREAIEFKNLPMVSSFNVITVCKDENQLSQTLLRYLNLSEDEKIKHHQVIHTEFAKKTKATTKLLENII